MRVVIDTNIIISAVGWGGNPLKILWLCIDRELELVLSEEIIDEISRVLMRKRFSGIEEEYKTGLIEIIRQMSIIVKPDIRVNVCRDHKDNMFIEAAIKGRAKWIISGDDDLLELKNYEGIRIITAEKFLKEYYIK